MAKVRFSCPKCQAVMQTNDDKIGFDIKCPQCNHQFTLVGQEAANSNAAIAAAGPASSSAGPASSSAVEETRQWVDKPVASDANVAKTPRSSAPYASANVPATGSIPPIYQGHAPNSHSCPFCQSRQPPLWKSEVSTAGWITCVILGCTTCIFFWVGFLIRDKYTVCSSCNVRLPRPFL